MIFKTLSLLIALIIVSASAPKEVTASRTQSFILEGTEVQDGRTFAVGQNVIRLWGVQAPAPTSSYAYAAALYLETILDSAPFECRYMGRSDDDAYVMLCNSEGDDIGAMMIHMGMAEASEEAGGYYDEVQAHAKKQKYGMWKS